MMKSFVQQAVRLAWCTLLPYLVIVLFTGTWNAWDWHVLVKVLFLAIFFYLVYGLRHDP